MIFVKIKLLTLLGMVLVNLFSRLACGFPSWIYSSAEIFQRISYDRPVPEGGGRRSFRYLSSGYNVKKRRFGFIEILDTLV